MFTKTQIKIMEIFVSNIVERFSIKQISELLKKHYPLIHRSVKDLIVKDFLIKDKQDYISLNYKNSHLDLAYIESLRKKDFLKKNKTCDLFLKDVLEKIKLDFFILLIFGSAVKKNNPRDIDVLFIIEDEAKIDLKEKLLHNIASNFSKNFDINVISLESAYEMLLKRDNPNVLNETLNNHIILFGAENYYRLLSNAR